MDGFYLITPFGRTALTARILEGIRRAEDDERMDMSADVTSQ